MDVNADHQAVARKIHQLAGVDDSITTLLLNMDMTSLSDLIKSQQEDKIDFLFLDHSKDLYLADLQQLEDAVLIQSGSFVAADNVHFFKMDDYRDHMKALADSGIVETNLVMSELEYILPDGKQADEPLPDDWEDGRDLKDGVELTIYNKDPPKNT